MSSGTRGILSHRLMAFSFVLAVLTGAGCCAHYSNLAQYKDSLRRYHDQSYQPDIQAQVDKATRYLHARCSDGGTNLAIVLDIDETALSNWEELAGSSEWGMDFGYNKAQFDNWERQQQDPAIGPVLALYQEARRAGVKVFFITGRHENMRPATEANLRRAGYDTWDGLYLKPDDSKASVTDYKSAIRKDLTVNGHYAIILNVGDQWSDLNGGYAEKCIKIPNPFYYIK